MYIFLTEVVFNYITVEVKIVTVLQVQTVTAMMTVKMNRKSHVKERVIGMILNLMGIPSKKKGEEKVIETKEIETQNISVKDPKIGNLKDNLKRGERNERRGIEKGKKNL